MLHSYFTQMLYNFFSISLLSKYQTVQLGVSRWTQLSRLRLGVFTAVVLILMIMLKPEI